MSPLPVPQECRLLQLRDSLADFFDVLARIERRDAEVAFAGGAEAGRQATGGRNVDHVCLSTGPFDHDAFRAHMAAEGVAIEREAFHGGARGQGDSFYIRDPFGNLLEIKGPPVYPDGRDMT